MITTFYSYKGGVGRSMALANVANWLRLQGLKVLVVDWDLEAPGIECFFVAGAAERERVHASPGVIDLIAAYVGKHAALPAEFFAKDDSETPPQRHARQATFLDKVLPSIESLVVQLQPDNQRERSDNPVHLLGPGMRAGGHAINYAHFVQRMDWTGLYERHDGDAFFTWLRGQMNSHFDIALVDSRTGMTEVGGVCTRELPDKVIALCAPNNQNLKGCEMVVRPLFTPEIVDSRDGRALEVAVIPTRVENAESDRLRNFEEDFRAALRGLSPPGAAGIDPDVMWDLRIPYIPRYSYGESMCVGAPDRVQDLETQYAKLGRYVASDLFRSLRDDARKRAVLAARSVELAAVAGVTLTPDERMEHAFGSLDKDTQEAARRILLRLVGFSDPTNPRTASAIPRPLERFSVQERVHLGELARAGIVRLESEGSPGKDPQSASAPRETARLAYPRAIDAWHRLRKWIDDDIDFLVWRHGLNTALAKHEEFGRKSQAMLRGAILAEARTWMGKRGDDLDERERDFIGRSARDARRTRTGMWAGVLTVVAVLGIMVFNLYRDYRDRTYREQAELSRQEAERITQEAKALIDNGNLKVAGDRLNQAIAISDKTRRAYVLRAELNLRQDRPREAIADAVKAIELDANDPAAWRVRARARFRLGENEGAIADYSRALALFAEDPETWYERGNAYKNAGDLEKAVADYDEAIKRGPKIWDIHLTRALALADLKRRDEAISALTQLSTEADPVVKKFAAAKLQELGVAPPRVKAPVIKSANRLFVHYVSPADRELVKALASTLASVQGVEFISRPTSGEVRFFFKEDRDFALKVKADTEAFLKNKAGIVVQLGVLLLEGYTAPSRQMQRAPAEVSPGTVELWLAPLRPAAAKK